MEFECKKVVTTRKDINESAADFLTEPIITTKAIGTCIVPLDKQRK